MRSVGESSERRVESGRNSAVVGDEEGVVDRASGGQSSVLVVEA